ncbi:UDP-N-acetylmuramoyl-L-alanine--D-glutamate ligase [Sulfoacidibacillus thermotolerans]|uniref:UDP-N-acetylmuramoylalanine--D-glutamate ligase n=1 Tax=Sulfoacidibacillus thermotolerans TaxID=1765684 RepID=A0A2U3D8T9_SULT2|nr:UDP-N-acetylmuramoyl-L-alanine--D-glutamate ligase [Sulfoacidibacillus thermotolerans]PWI57704.1 UDP-N-acetylmuramoylalanine--D-glutamate ligase [Sulfoacidibacillus thermotolerans]
MNFANQSVLVIGLAKSGVAVAKLLHQLHAHVVVNDQSPREKVAREAEELEALGVQVITGGHPLELVDHCDILVKNPGIRYDQPQILRALARGIPVLTEVEVAAQVIRAPIIGITGSNGKTTTTTLVGEMLRTSQLPVTVAGNIGTPLSAVASAVFAKQQHVVVELSSFQLQGTVTFHPHIAAWLNLYPAHLDYHGNLDNYREAKRKIFANQGLDDLSILNRDQEVFSEIAKTLQSKVWWVSLEQKVEFGAYIENDWLMLSAPLQGQSIPTVIAILPIDQIVLRGRHNLQNALFASAIAFAAGASPDAIRTTLTSFAGVAHRMEFVREVDGIKFINDSKATNPQAALQAIGSFTEPIVGILGGLDRGDDLSPLAAAVREHMKAVVTIGQSGERMAELARSVGVPVVKRVQTLEEAVQLAKNLAVAGDVVLLSPAAASWDMFASFEERGRIFKEAVHML